jgi:hypothetical protein
MPEGLSKRDAKILVSPWLAIRKKYIAGRTAILMKLGGERIEIRSKASALP